MFDINTEDEIKINSNGIEDMNNYLECQNRRIQNIIFIIGIPASMAGVKIATVNSAMEELVPELRDISESNLDVEIRISIMSVSDYARWETFFDKADENYKYNHLTSSESEKINALSAIELLRKDFIDTNNGRSDFLKPIIYWFVDNKVNPNYADVFKFVKGYKLFKNSVSCGIAIGDEADRDFLNIITDDVINVYTPEVLKKYIRFKDIDESIADEEHNFVKIVYPQKELVPVLRQLGDDGRARKFLCIYQDKEVVYRELYNPIISADELYKETKYKIDAGRIPGEWPIACTECIGEKFGYLHDYVLYQDRYCGFDSIKSRILACRNVIKIYGVLHTKGFCFQHATGITNFLADYKTGDMRLTNVDEIMLCGQHHGIGRNSRETAPELYWNNNPSSVEGDRYSLAVFLFELLFDGHPFEGKKLSGIILTEEIHRKLYVDSPVYVWDFKDDSNRPLKHQNNGLVAPNYIMNAFSYSFSNDVVHQLNGKLRITEKEWFSLFKQWWNEMEGNQ